MKLRNTHLMFFPEKNDIFEDTQQQPARFVSVEIGATLQKAVGKVLWRRDLYGDLEVRNCPPPIYTALANCIKNV